jgi:hypothetical protein
MNTSSTTLTTLATGAVGALALGLLTACGGASGTEDGGSPAVTITSPTDGTTVGSDVQVTWKTNVELGPPESGRDHVHVFVDGHSNDYTVVGGHSFMVTGLSPGPHSIDVTLQHADHSSAGGDDEVDVTVSPNGQAPASQGSSPSDSPSPSPSSTPRYGY